MVNEALGPIHFAPAAWPTEPGNPIDCGVDCGQWQPYTRFQGDINDPRVQDPSNGGTSPQNYVNVSSSCIDKSHPSIYYYLYKHPSDASKDVLMFRWRVEQVANNYATGPSAGNYRATDPWSSALWTVLFDVDGDGYRDLAAHLNGSSGDPSHPVDMIAGIWGNIPTQSIDYLNDPSIKLIAHNPTAFTSGSKILNFHDSLSPNTSWPAGSATNSWDYGTTRAKLVSNNSCNEYFVDYQIPIRMLDASNTGPDSSLNGPKITRDTPISMLFCTANSLNNPFQKDCSLNREYIGDASLPGPFGDYLSFNKDTPYAQPIISSVTASAPASCAVPSYQLTAKVQDTLYVNNSGVIEPSIKSVKFFYWYDKDGDGTTAGDTDSAWNFAVDGTLKPGTLNTWIADWDSSSLLRGRYLIGVQAVDDKTRHDDGVPDTPVDNRTFSYIAGSNVAATEAQIYNNAWSWNGTSKTWVQGSGIGWLAGQAAVFPVHGAATLPGVSEDWYGNPDVTGLQVATTGVDLAINSCGVAPTISKVASPVSVATSQAVEYTVTIDNDTGSAITLTQIDDLLPGGFTYTSTNTVTNGAAPVVPTTLPTIGAGGTVSWILNGATGISIANSSSVVLNFTATASSVAGTYNNTVSASTSFGSITSEPVAVGVDAARISLSKMPDTYLVSPGGAVVYTLAYSNDSSVPVTGAVLTDTLPANVSCTSYTIDGGAPVSCSGTSVSINLGTLTAGATGTVTLTAAVGTGYSATSLLNSATLDVLAPDGMTHVVKTATSTIAVDIPAPEFSLTKTANTALIGENADVTWTIAYSNYGTDPASSVVISDPLPSGFTYVSSSPVANSAPAVGANGTVSWNLGTIANGASGSVQVVARSTTPFSGIDNPATNTATISWTGGTPVTSSSDIGVVQSGAICSSYYFRDTIDNVGFDGSQQLATRSPVPTAANTGSSITVNAPGKSGGVYLEAVRFYQGPASVSDVTFSGTLTNNIYIDRSPGPALNFRAIVYDYDSDSGTRVQLGLADPTTDATMSFGGNTTGLLTFSVPLSGTLKKGHRLLWVYEVQSNHNTSTYPVEFQYNGTTANSISGSGSATAISYANYCVTPPANLVLQKAVNASTVNVTGSGRSLTYTLNYTNTSGSSAATNAVLSDLLPAGTTFVSASSTPAAASTSTPSVGANGSVSWNFASLAANASGSASVTVAIPDDLTGTSSIDNTASLLSDQTLAINAGAKTSVTGGVAAGSPALTISKSVDKSFLLAGDTVTYTLTVVNTGTASASSVVISDDFPEQAYFTYGSCSTSVGSCTPSGTPDSSLAWSVGTLAAGSSATLSFTMNVAAIGVPAGVATLGNLATVADSSYCTSAAVAGCTSDTASVSISGNPDLALSKSVLPSGPHEPGDTLTYTLTVTNNGSSAASGVVISDPTPVNTSFKGAITASLGSGNFDPVNNQVVFNVGSLAAGATATLSFQATVSGTLASGSTTLINNATVIAGNASSRTAIATTSASANPLMQLTKTGPASVSYPSALLTADVAGETVLFVNSTVAFSVNQYVIVGAGIARITAVTGNSLTVSAPLTASSGTAVIASATYLLSYQNSGDADAASVVVSDPLPAGWAFVAASPAATSGPAVGANGTVTWNVGTVESGAGGTLQLVLVPTAVGATTNTATLTDSVYCIGGTPPTSCSSSVTTATGGLSVSKTTSTPNTVAGGTANWTITVTNSLATPVTGINVTDILPSGFAYSSTGTIATIGATRTVTTDPTPGDTQPAWGVWTLPGNGTLSIPFTASVGVEVGPATYQNGVTLTTTTPSAGVTPFDPLATTDEDVTVLANGTGIASGIVYHDANNNGIYDVAVDFPLAGVAVTIIDSTLTTYVAYTNTNGFFSRVVAAGSTIVDVDNSTLPPDLILRVGTDGVDPSTLNVPDGGGASRNTGHVAAVGAIGSVTGNIWNDVDLSANWDAGEVNMPGVQVILRDALTNTIVAVAYSNVMGNYSFPNVASGNYIVDIVLPDTYFLTTANDPASVTVSSGETVTANFGLAEGKVMSGMVFQDNGTGGGVPADGLQNGSEPGTHAGGLNVVVVSSADVVLSTATVAASGAWSAAVPSGTNYKAYVTTASPIWEAIAAPLVKLPTGWLVIGENLSGAVDSVADGTHTAINATVNESGINFGLDLATTVVNTYTLSGVVFNDMNGSGLINGAEPGTNGGDLYALLLDGSGIVVAISNVATNGTWSFSAIENGGYSVRLSTTVGTIGNAAPETSLPVGWFDTGESADSVSTDGNADGNLSVTISGANLTTAMLGIRQRADVIVQKIGPEQVEGYGTVTYTVRVENSGPGRADGTVLVDKVPEGVAVMDWTCGNVTGGAVCPVALGTGTINQVLASLPATGSLVYTVTVRASASGSITNSATATVPPAIVDPDVTNNTSSVTTRIGAVPIPLSSRWSLFLFSGLTLGFGLAKLKRGRARLL